MQRYGEAIVDHGRAVSCWHSAKGGGRDTAAHAFALYALPAWCCACICTVLFGATLQWLSLLTTLQLYLRILCLPFLVIHWRQWPQARLFVYVYILNVVTPCRRQQQRQTVLCIQHFMTYAFLVFTMYFFVT